MSLRPADLPLFRAVCAPVAVLVTAFIEKLPLSRVPSPVRCRPRRTIRCEGIVPAFLYGAARLELKSLFPHAPQHPVLQTGIPVGIDKHHARKRVAEIARSSTI